MYGTVPQPCRTLTGKLSSNLRTCEWQSTTREQLEQQRRRRRRRQQQQQQQCPQWQRRRRRQRQQHGVNIICMEQYRAYNDYRVSDIRCNWSPSTKPVEWHGKYINAEAADVGDGSGTGKDCSLLPARRTDRQTVSLLACLLFLLFRQRRFPLPLLTRDSRLSDILHRSSLPPSTSSC